MAIIKSYTDLEQSKKLTEILPIESADGGWYGTDNPLAANTTFWLHTKYSNKAALPAWSLAALLGVLPEINGIPLTLEKVKAEDGYEGYYYHIEYKDIVLIPYSKNPIDACVAMIENLHELKML